VSLVLLGGLVCVLAGCGKIDYTWGWYVFNPIAPGGREHILLMLSGLQMTLLVTLASLVGTQVVGFLVALMRLTRNRSLNGLAALYLEVFRNIPLFVLIFAVYYVVPILLGIGLSAFQALVLAIVLNESAFVCESYRAGIESISRGHIEAAHSLGMSRAQTMRRIVLPQAIRRVIPPITSEFVIIVKGSALGSFVGVLELTRRAGQMIANLNQSRQLEVYAFLTIEYLIILVTLSRFSQWLEKKMATP
jgi:glutamine transport system permease protein